MTETALAKYDRPLVKPVQTVENASLLLRTHESAIAEHMARAAGVEIGQVISTAITELATADTKLRAALMACNGQSILKSVVDAARYGLIFGKVLGQAYLIPFKGECQLMVGYRGYEALIYRGGAVLAIQSGVVYEGDEYDVVIGRPLPILHRPSLTASHHADKIVAAYVIASMREGLCVAESMNREDLNRIRSKSKMATSGAYVTDTAEMLRKAPIRRIAKHLPLSPTDRALLDEIMAVEDEREGARAATGNGVIEGEARAADLLSRTNEGESPPEPGTFELGEEPQPG
ncbi:MAG TPA: recombinase RecT [Phycisphaerae bacterium]|nr:recombinase RecT [Phycisphaerae bacterium]